MSVQTKLSLWEKSHLKELRADQAGELHVFQCPEKRVTVGVRYIPGHNAARVFVSLASPDETKFRPKVGEFQVRLAFIEWVSGAGYIGIPFAVPPAYTPQDIAECVAYTVGDVG